VTDLADLTLDAIACTAWTFTSNRLEFHREPTPDEFKVLLTYLKTAGNLFWVGDAMAKLASHYRDQFANDDRTTHIREQRESRCEVFDADQVIEKRVTLRIRDLCSPFDTPAKAFEAWRVCETLGDYRAALPFQFHVDAVKETGRGDRDEAIEWLERAEAHAWTPSELRAQIRLSRAEHAPARELRTLTVSGILRHAGNQLRDLLRARPVAEWANQELLVATEASEAIVDVLVAIQDRLAVF
jgi:hypothetical protein